MHTIIYEFTVYWHCPEQTPVEHTLSKQINNTVFYNERKLLVSYTMYTFCIIQNIMYNLKSYTGIPVW